MTRRSSFLPRLFQRRKSGAPLRDPLGRIERNARSSRGHHSHRHQCFFSVDIAFCICAAALAVTICRRSIENGHRNVDAIGAGLNHYWPLDENPGYLCQGLKFKDLIDRIRANPFIGRAIGPRMFGGFMSASTITRTAITIGAGRSAGLCRGSSCPIIIITTIGMISASVRPRTVSPGYAMGPTCC